MFKTSQRLQVSSLWFLAITVFSLSNSAARPADTGEHGGEEGEMIGGRDGDSLPHENTHLLSSGNSHNLLWFVTGLFSLSLRRSLVCFFALLFFTTTHYLSRWCWLFIFPILCILSPFLSHPSLLPLFFPSPPVPVPLIPTGIVIPSPQRRLNDFILPRPCLLLLMMCLVPSYFDVEYQNLLVYMCVLGVEEEEWCASSLGGAKNCGGKGKKKKMTRMNWYTSAPFSCAVSMLPRDQRSAFLKPLLSNDGAADVISWALLRRCQPHWHATKDGSPFRLFQRSDNYCFLCDAVYLCLFRGFPLSTYTCIWENHMFVLLCVLNIKVNYNSCNIHESNL